MRTAPAAFLVHVFTASGVACALLALLAAAHAQWTAMFAWLALALVIDGVDGTLARRLRVAERLPRWSGEALDLVVDFTTYVFVPAFALVKSGLLPEAAAVPLGVAVVVSGALYFADTRMKTADHHFRGFPALWNAVALHLFVLRLSPWIAALVVAAFVVATFLPLRMVHPLRVARGRGLTIAVLAAWSALGLYALATSLRPGDVAAWLFAALGLSLLAAGLFTARE